MSAPTLTALAVLLKKGRSFGRIIFDTADLKEVFLNNVELFNENGFGITVLNDERLNDTMSMITLSMNVAACLALEHLGLDVELAYTGAFWIKPSAYVKREKEMSYVALIERDQERVEAMLEEQLRVVDDNGNHCEDCGSPIDPPETVCGQCD